MTQDLKTFLDTSFLYLKHCYKSQDALLGDLRIDVKTLNELCKCSYRENVKLQAEIDNGLQMTIRLTSSRATIKAGNTELTKRLEDLKDTKASNELRIQNNDKKYDSEWLIYKQRFETMTLYKKLYEATNKDGTIRHTLVALNVNMDDLKKQIKIKRDEISQFDKSRTIELAKFLCIDRVMLIEKNQEKRNAIKNLKLEIEGNKYETQNHFKNHNIMRQNKQEEESPLPFLSLAKEIQSCSLNNSPNETFQNAYIPRLDYLKREIPSYKSIETFASAYKIFNRYKPYENEKKIEANSKKIIILEDVQINTDAVANLVSSLNPTAKIVEMIENDKESTINNEIEEIEDNDESMIPPTQFRDNSQSSQKMDDSNEAQKKKVRFHVPDDIDMVNDYDQNVDDKKPGDNAFGLVQEDNYTKMKESYLKKYNLDSSPQFMYSKKPDLRNINIEKPVTSKFFIRNIEEEKEKEKEEVTDTNVAVAGPKDDNMDFSGIPQLNLISANTPKHDDVITEEMTDTVPECADPQGFGESMNLTVNTTCYEDSDVPCIDASLLLSPKGDMQPENQQESPIDGFLTGLRKGLSIFGNESSDKPDSSDGSGNFTFDFGGSKKNRGGLFNMFN